jgi:hypothetical protein
VIKITQVCNYRIFIDLSIGARIQSVMGIQSVMSIQSVMILLHNINGPIIGDMFDFLLGLETIFSAFWEQKINLINSDAITNIITKYF